VLFEIGSISKVFTGILLADAVKEGKLGLASAKDEFFYKVVDAQLSFHRDATGKVAAVVLHQNGLDMRAPKK
jgi:D-alanyl-D-alanine-carboxypeptidase/D-alanyl-D-alanine-endopeptidase